MERVKKLEILRGTKQVPRSSSSEVKFVATIGLG
jgi:hypothetical protein